MSFWDSIKPSKRPPAAVKVDVSADQTGLTLGWDDGLISHVTGQTLRQMCPCAECVEEFSGRRVLDVEKIPPSMKMLEVAPVGNYALTFTFGDLHRTGIFNWSTLRELSKPA